MDVITFREYFLQWMPVGLIAILISTAIVSLAYMLSKFLNDEKLTAWAKEEFFQVIFSIIIITSAVSFYVLVDGLLHDVSVIDPHMQDLCQEPFIYYASEGAQTAATNPYQPPCHIKIAGAYLEDMLRGAVRFNEELLGTIMLYGLLVETSVSFAKTPLSPWGRYVMHPFAGLTIVKNSLDTCFDFVMKSMMFLAMQLYFLHFMYQALFPILLTWGLILRTFFFTRKLGGLLIALALSLYAIYPSVYMIGGYILQNSYPGGMFDVIDQSVKMDIQTAIYSYKSSEHCEDNSGCGVQGEWCNEHGLCVPLQPAAEIDVTPIDEPPQEEVEVEMSDLTSKVSTLSGGSLLGKIKDRIFNQKWLIGEYGVLDNTARLLVFTVFMPFIALMVTLAGVKKMSPLFGGDVEIAGLSRFL